MGKNAKKFGKDIANQISICIFVEMKLDYAG